MDCFVAKENTKENSKKVNQKSSNQLKKKKAKASDATKPHSPRMESNPSQSPHQSTSLSERFTQAVSHALRELPTVTPDSEPTDHLKEASFWKEKYEQLRDLRETEPETRLRAWMDRMDTQEQEIRALVTQLGEGAASLVEDVPTPSPAPAAKSDKKHTVMPSHPCTALQNSTHNRRR